jgi:transcriptional regulator with XRE-family HTH domain
MARTKTQTRKSDMKDTKVSDIRKIRIERYGTLKDAEKATGISASLIYRIETNKTRPNATTMREVSVWFGVPIRKLINFKWNPEKKRA